MNPISAALTLWQAGLASSAAIVDWADSEMVRIESPPQELIDLSLTGPERSLKQPERDFSARPLSLTYEEELGLRAMFLDPSSSAELSAFVDWASKECIGLDVTSEVVQFGYHLDHLISDCEDRAGAMSLARERLPSLRTSCCEMAERIVLSVPNLRMIKEARDETL